MPHINSDNFSGLELNEAHKTSNLIRIQNIVCLFDEAFLEIGKMKLKMGETKMQAEDAAFLEEQLNQLLESTLRMEADLNAAFRNAKN